MDFHKGITPVIAIVFLMAITIGAVGMFYEQLSGVMDAADPTKELKKQQRSQQSSYSIIGVRKNPSTDEIEVTIKNTGDSKFDLSKWATVKIGVNDQKPQALATLGGTPDECYNSLGTLAPGDTANCPTGVPWPSANGGREKFQLLLKGVNKDTYLCTAGDQYC